MYANGRVGAPSFRLVKGVIEHVAVATSDDAGFVGWFENAGDTGEARLVLQRTDTRAGFDGPVTEVRRFARSGRLRLLASGTRAAGELRVLAAYGAPRSWDADSAYQIGLRAMACSR